MAEMERSSGPGNGQKLAFVLTLDPPGSVIDGIPTYSVSDDTLIAVELNPDNMSGFVTNKDTLCTGATVHVEADADLGQGVSNISTDSPPIDVIDHPATPATGFGFSFNPVPA